MCDDFDSCDLDTSDVNVDMSSDTDYDVDIDYDANADCGMDADINYDTDADLDYDLGLDTDCDTEVDMDYDWKADTGYDTVEAAELDLHKEAVDDMESVDPADLSAEEISDKMLEAWMQEDQKDIQEEDVKVLRRDPDELVDAGMRNVEDILDVRRDDMIDKGLSEDEIEEAIARERNELQQEFIRDAFPPYAADVSVDRVDEILRDAAELRGEADVIDNLAGADVDFEEETDDMDDWAEIDANFEEEADDIDDWAEIDADFEEEADDADNLANVDADFEEETSDADNLADVDADFEEETNDADNLADVDADFEEETNDADNSADVDTDFEEEADDKDELSQEGADYTNEEINHADLLGNDSDLLRDVVRQNVQDIRLPSDGGTWENPEQIRDGLWRPDDDTEFIWRKSGKTHRMTGAEFREHYGVEGVTYQHGEPDFEPFEDEVLGHVKLGEMPDHRDGPDGSYCAATRAAAERLGIKEEDVERRMEQEGLTWHECGDRITVRAVPTAINSAFPHTGGISLQRSVQAMSETLSEYYPNVNLTHDSLKGTAEGIMNARKNIRETYRLRKRNL